MTDNGGYVARLRVGMALVGTRNVVKRHVEVAVHRSTGQFGIVHGGCTRLRVRLSIHRRWRTAGTPVGMCHRRHRSAR